MTREPETTQAAHNPSHAAANDRSPLAISRPAVRPLQLLSSENQQQEESVVPGGREDIKPFQLQTARSGLPDGLRSGIEQLGPGQEKHLPHEAWHVVQQKQGRVQSLAQMKGNIPVNDDPRLEQEATTMGAKAMQMKAAEDACTVPVSGISSAQVTQMVNFPKDSTGDISRVMDTISSEKEGKKEITGAALQTEIIDRVKKGGSKESGGYRLGTFAFQPEGLARIDDPYEEKHGMDMLPEKFDVSTIDPLIIPLVIGTMTDAGQWAYLRENWKEISATHHVIVDVDCQFDRSGEVGFHKDSRGTTVFFNLSFSNEADMQGPDSYPDTVGAPDLEEKLPKVVQADIAERRKQEKDLEDKSGNLAEIQSPKLGPWGRVSLSDANLYHSTPKLGHRNKKPPPKFKRKYYVERLVKLTDKGDGFDYHGYFDKMDDKELQSWMVSKMEQYNTHNSESESMKGQEDTMRDKAATRKRRLSIDLDEKNISKYSLAKQSKIPRTFIRTWIRMYPKPSTATGMEEDKSLTKAPM